METNFNKKIEKTARQEIYAGKFTGKLDIQEFDEHPHFSAGIEATELNQIFLKINPKYEEIHPGKTEPTVKDIIRHEINHKKYSGFNGCPRDLETHAEKIIEPMAEILSEKGYNVGDIHYIANAFEDSILHSDLSRRFSLDGIVDFFDDVGDYMKDKKFTDFYEAHVKLNLFLFGNKKQKKQVTRYFKNSDKVKEVLINFLNRTGLSGLTQEISIYNRRKDIITDEGEITGVIEKKEQQINIKDRGKIRQYLNNPENWPELSKIYAEEFSKLMQPGYAMPLINHSGKGTKGQEIPQKGDKNSKSENSSGGDKIKGPKEGNVFDRQMYSPDFKKQRVQKAYNAGEEIPGWMDSFEGLDLLYQSLAQKLNIKVETFTKQSSMPICYYGKKQFDPEKDNTKHLTFGFNGDGKVDLMKKRYHENLPLEYKTNPRGFPEIRFCLLDTSGSMKDSPDGSNNIGNDKSIPWGDQSKYHYALLGWYGLLEYLKQNHLLSQMNVSLGNFGDETIIKKGLSESKQLALNPQFGNTYLDINKVKKSLQGNEMLVFTISDGEIANWSSIREQFIKYAKQNHYFHLQIGQNNETTEDLKNAGLFVEHINDAKDLATKVIDLTDKLYRG